MATINDWNNAVLAANVTFNGGTMSIGTDSTDNAITIGTAASAGRTITIGNGTAASATVIACGTGGITVGTTANAHASTLGSTSSTSSTTVQSGSGALNITATNGAITINSGTGTVSIGSDATNATYNFATGAGAKVVTLGSTSGASSLALKTGTADFSLASATGTIMSSIDTGETIFPLQPAFLATSGSAVANITGNGATFILGTTNAVTEIFDQNADFNTNGTFTAPVTGKYYFSGLVNLNGCTIAATITARPESSNTVILGGLGRPASASNFSTPMMGLVDMDAADTCTLTLAASGEAANTDDLASTGQMFCGSLVC